MKNTEEIKRLSFGPSDDETTELFKAEIVAICDGNSAEVLERTIGGQAYVLDDLGCVHELPDGIRLIIYGEKTET